MNYPEEYNYQEGLISSLLAEVEPHRRIVGPGVGTTESFPYYFAFK